MKIFQKTIATLLAICMMFTVLPQSVYENLSLDVFAADVVGTSGYINSNGIVGKDGGYMGEMPYYVISLMDTPKNYNDLTNRGEEAVVAEYRDEWIKIDDYATQSLYFVPYDGTYTGKDESTYPLNEGLAYAHKGSSANPLQYIGVGYYSEGRIYNDLNMTYNNVPIRKSSSQSTNYFYNYIMAPGGAYDRKEIKSIADLGNGQWRNYIDMTPIAATNNDMNARMASNGYQYSVAVLGYLLGDDDNVDGRIEEFTNPEGISTSDIKLLTAREKLGLAVGYVSLLVNLYNIAEGRGLSGMAGKYEAAINNYCSNSNNQEAPVTLGIEKAYMIQQKNSDNSQSVFSLKVFDYMRLYLMTDASYDIIDESFIQLNYPASAGSTKEMMTSMLKESVKNFPLSMTTATNPGFPRRIADNAYKHSGSQKYAGALGWVQNAYQFTVKERHEVQAGNEVKYRYHGGKADGILNTITIQDGSDLYGFMIVGNYIATPPPVVSFSVDSTVQCTQDVCSEDVKPTSPAKIRLTIDGGANTSGLIEVLNSRLENNEIQIPIEVDIKRTVYRDSIGNVFEGREKEDCPELEAGVALELSGQNAINVLSGQTIELQDTEILNDMYTRDRNSATTMIYKYDVDIKITVDGAEYEYKSDDIVLKNGSTPLNFASFQFKAYAQPGARPEPVPQVDVTAEKWPSDVEGDIENWRNGPEHWETTAMVKSYEYTSEGSAFAEIKSNYPLQEKYEVLGGIPSTEELYFSVGGSEFKVAMVLQYWMNQHSRDRTYHVHFEGNICEYNNEEVGKGDRMAIQNPKATIKDSHGTWDDNEVHCLNEDSKGGFDDTIIARWTGTDKCEAVTHSCPTCGNTIHDEHNNPFTNYNAALADANALVTALNAEDVVWTSASDKVERKQKWTATITKDIKDESDNTTAGDNGSSCSGHSCNGHGKYNTPCGAHPCTPGTACATDHEWEIIVTATIPKHSVCGPCCGHHMPALWDMWKQGLIFDYAKISQIRLFKLDQGSVDGLDELTGIDGRVFANVVSGNPTYFMNIAQQTASNYDKATGTENMPVKYTDPDTERYKEFGRVDYLPMNKNELAKDNHNQLTYYSSDTRLSQSSRAGRLRYTLAPGETNVTINFTEQGNGKGGSYTLDKERMVATWQHDDVFYEAGKRTMNCDGMATTGNFGKTNSNTNDPGKYHTSKTGHVNEWADGCLYTTIQSYSKFNAASDFADYWNPDKSIGNTYVPDEMMDNDEKALSREVYGQPTEPGNTKDAYFEDYDHHGTLHGFDMLQQFGIEKKDSYYTRSDEVDRNTAEWKFFDAARKTKVVANVISDFLILQTSGGDQAIFYYEKATEPTELQAHFKKLDITEEEMFDQNPLSIFQKNSDVCVDTENGALKEANLVDLIMVGGYNGQYNNTKNKYKPYSSVTNQYYNFPKDKQFTYDATKKTGTYNVYGGSTIRTIFDSTSTYGDPAKTISRPKRQATSQDSSFKILQDNIRILPTAPNKLYTPTDARVWYSQVEGFYSTDMGYRNAERDVMHIDTIGNVSIGNPQKNEFGEDYKINWGNEVGVEEGAKYFATPDGNGNSKTVNNVVVYTPVSTEDAMILEQGDLEINGLSISRDQRVDNSLPNMNDMVNKLKVCPLDPAECEYRVLNCKYHEPQVLAQFNFEDTYEATEQQLIDGSFKNVTVTKQNTYTNGDGTLVTTNILNGIEYQLPTGFSKSNGKLVANGGVGTRWTIPFADIGLSNSANNTIQIDMDLTVNSGSLNNMVVGLHNIGLLITNTNSAETSLTSRSLLDNTKQGVTLDSTFDGVSNVTNAKVSLKLAFNNIKDSKVTINGKEATVEVFSEYKKTWTTQVDENGNEFRTQITEVIELDDLVAEPPSGYKTTDIGSNINIGCWGQDNAYGANFTIDNLKITLLGGSTDHTSACYETVITHSTKKVHVCDENCYTKEDMYICNGVLNSNYQLGCGKEEGEIEVTGETSRTYNYTGGIQSVTLAKGQYILETWGAQGNSAGTSYGVGGKGGYSYGILTLDETTTLYIGVGGQNGYNGGGSANNSSSGGGATHIGLKTGLLTAFSSDYSSKLIMVAGGGGGVQAAYTNSYSLSSVAGVGGGTSGTGGSKSIGSNTSYYCYAGNGGTQSAGGAGGSSYNSNVGNTGTFGQGGNGYSTTNGGGGGGGFYGGGGGSYVTAGTNYSTNGGGGSGYVNTTKLENEYTTAGNESFNAVTAGLNETGHSGNGAAKITVVTDSNNGKAGFALYDNGAGLNGTEYVYSGNTQTLTLQPGRYFFECYGAGGGSYQLAASAGGYASGYYNVTTPTVATIVVGGAGGAGSGGAGGYNGGAAGASHGGGGGGKSHISINGTIVIAAGGGGGGGHNTSNNASSLGGATISAYGSGGTGAGCSARGTGGASYVGGVENATTTAGGGSAAGTNGKIRITVMGHIHSGVAGKDYPNGCYTVPTEHKHIKTEKVLVCDKEYDIVEGTAETYTFGTGGNTYTSDYGSTSIDLPAGRYKLEVWGAQGGCSSFSNTTRYAKGGYSVGYLTLSQPDTLYVVIGGKGTNGDNYTSGTYVVPGGYNGGGDAGQHDGGSGGGATHIGLKSGLLTAFSSDYSSQLLMVAGGAGGVGQNADTYDHTDYSYGGGTSGGVGVGYSTSNLAGATQNSGYKFGEGQDGTYDNGGAGGGFYGGLASTNTSSSDDNSGSGGSGYVNTALLESGTCETIAGNKSFPNTAGTGNEIGHSGNGFAKITGLGRQVEHTHTDECYIMTNGRLICGLEEDEDAGVVYTFGTGGNTYTSASGSKSMTLPAGTYDLEVWGAQGGGGYDNTSYTSVGGKGGYSKGTITLVQDTPIYVYVGGVGSTDYSSSYRAGGFNGGGYGTAYAGAGGGASDIRIGTNSIYSRVIVAGGGGGSTRNSNSNIAQGGYGGGTSGGYAYSNGQWVGTSYYAGPGTQTGSISSNYRTGYEGSFGSAYTSYYSSYCGGGGGGWYGGGNGNHHGIGGAGGSGYVYTASTASYYPQGCTLNSSYYLTDAETKGGNTSFPTTAGTSNETGHSGNGFVKITSKGHKHTENCYGQNYSCGKVESGTLVGEYSLTSTTVTVPLSAGTYKLEVWGAEGGAGYSDSNYIGYGGKGGYSVGYLTLNSANTAYVTVGGKGGNSTSSTVSSAGYNGGGSGYYYGGAGGGATDIRLGGTALSNRIIVAGGGGGGSAISSYIATGGYGGGTIGGSGYQNGNWSNSYTTTGGTQSSGGSVNSGWSVVGSLGQGGNYYSTSYSYIGGGGGGYYGGAAGAYHGYSGAGGSGYVSSTLKDAQTLNGNSLIPTISNYNYNNYYFGYGNTVATEVGHSGNGYARIYKIDHHHDNTCYAYGYGNSCNIATGASEIVGEYSYTGSAVPVTLPAGEYKLEVWGAQGGTRSGYTEGGRGGYSVGNIVLSKSTNVYVYVGGAGTSGTNVEGGFNGGGNGYSSNSRPMTSGGGGTDIRIGSDSLYSRVIVAGGGGGGYETGTSGNGSTASYGGGLTGGTGSGNTDRYGYGGTQTAGGAKGSYNSWGGTIYAGSFGKGGYSTSAGYSNGGGGGWYGGGASTPDGGAGGGSGYVYTASTATNYPSGCTLNSTYYLSNAQTYGGNTSFTSPSGSSESGHTGSGYARITRLNHVHTSECSGIGYICGKTESTGSQAGTPINFDYTNGVQTQTLQAGKYKLEVWGAAGGEGCAEGSGYSTIDKGGMGGYSVGELTLTSSTNVYVYVGGQGTDARTSQSNINSSFEQNNVYGGFNGGGKGYLGGAGGGATDIRLASDSLYSRVIVAGGGGGGSIDATNNQYGGYGGGTSGQAGGSGGSGGTQTGGYSFGIGQAATSGNTGGGGGGWYGGYTTNSSDDSGGGGGSGYVYTSATASNYPTGCTLNSNYYLTSASTTAGNQSFLSPTGTSETGHSGNGYARITPLEVEGHTHTNACLPQRNGKVTDFEYSGKVETLTLQPGMHFLETWGAQGGSYVNEGGKGGYSMGVLNLEETTTVYVRVGGQGANGNSTSTHIAEGGFNGGGKGGIAKSNASGSAGGGASDIRIGTDDLYSRVIVAGGGGGAGSYSGGDRNGGAGGGEEGLATGSESTSKGRGGGAGTQTAGGATSNSKYTGDAGSFGQGGNGYTGSKGGYGGGGGGGGWYGGGSGGTGASTTSNGGGGGGSGYVYTESTVANYPSGCTLNSTYYLVNAQTIAGDQTFLSPDGTDETGHSGNGHIRITSQVNDWDCKFIPAGTFMCTGELNTVTDFNSHEHTEECLLDEHQVPPATFTYTETVQTYVIPYTDYYTIETYGPHVLGQGGYAKATYRFKQGTRLYIYVGSDTYNDIETDVRLVSKPGNQGVAGEEGTYQTIIQNSNNSRLVRATSRDGFANTFGNYEPIGVETGTRGTAISGMVTITCNNSPLAPTLDDIVNGNLTEDEVIKHIGPELYEMITNSASVFKTYSEFSMYDTKGVISHTNGGVFFVNDNILLEARNSTAPKFYIRTDLEAQTLRRVRVTLVNNSNATEFKIGVNDTTNSVTVPMQANSANEQILTFNVADICKNADTSILYFSPQTKGSGKIEISKIELLGHATFVRDSSGYTNEDLLTLEDFSTDDTKGFAVNKNATLSYSNGNLLVTNTDTGSWIEWTTLESIDPNAIRYIELKFINNTGSSTYGEMFCRYDGLSQEGDRPFSWNVGATSGTQTVYIDTLTHTSYNVTTNTFKSDGVGFTGNSIDWMYFGFIRTASGTVQVDSIKFIGNGTTTGTGSYSYQESVVAGSGTTWTFGSGGNTFNQESGSTSIDLKKGTYKLEVWGAQGGSYNTNIIGGKGGYSKGEYTLTTDDTLYVNIGGKGSWGFTATGGYNGGGSINHNSTYEQGAGSGGGATHIGLKSGLLSTFSSDYTSQLLLVAGGGGGGVYGNDGGISGGAGGGTSGVAGSNNSYTSSTAGTQNSGGSYGNINNHTSYSAGSFGLGGSGAGSGDTWYGGAGGGGFYGGGYGGTHASGSGGSGYVNTSKLNSGTTSTIAGNLSTIPTISGSGTEKGHSGSGYAKITAMTDIRDVVLTSSPVTITSSTTSKVYYTATYNNPLLKENVKQTIITNYELIPDYVDGDYNPLWLCRFDKLNVHLCVTKDGEQLCKITEILKCNEPHHKKVTVYDENGNVVGETTEHYPGTNDICWDACGNDENHKLTKTQTELGSGENVRLAEFLQLDEGFTVYFPNRGDFYGNGALGLSSPQVTRGYGYKNNMDTTNWTREKRVRFPFDVIYEGELYNPKHWIELDVEQEVFNFYLPVSNPEMSNVTVEFEVEAINCGTTDGVEVVAGISYDSVVNETYELALKTFIDNYMDNWIADIKDVGGYKIPFTTPRKESKATDVKEPDLLDFEEVGYLQFYLNKMSDEDELEDAIDVVNEQIQEDFEGVNDNSNIIYPHENTRNSINSQMKNRSVNDNKTRVSNIQRRSSLQSLHGAYKFFYMDVIGRIGNFTITDTEDYKFSNFFKWPTMQTGDLTDAKNWLVDGLVMSVDEGIQNYYIGDTYDIRGYEAQGNTLAGNDYGNLWLDTYGTQSWMRGEFVGEDGEDTDNYPIIAEDDDGVVRDRYDTTLECESDQRDITKPNLYNQILTADVNNIEVLREEEMQFGYDIFTSIVTFGNYQNGRVQVVPKYYALKLTDEEVPNVTFQADRNEYIPLDVYISRGGTYTAVNIFGNAGNGQKNIGGYTLDDYSFNLDWTVESHRRNYSLEEKARTDRICDSMKQYIYNIDNIDDIAGDGQFIAENFELLRVEEAERPKGMNNYLGTSQYMLMTGNHRTFIGSSNTYGNNIWVGPEKTTQFGVKENGKFTASKLVEPAEGSNALKEDDFERAVQRWHGKLGVPSSSVFVPHGEAVNAETIKYVMNDSYAIICTAEIIVMGSTWNLAYSQPWFNSLTIGDEEYETHQPGAGDDHYPGRRKEDGTPCPDCPPPIIAVYSSEASSVDDIEIVGSH